MLSLSLFLARSNYRCSPLESLLNCYQMKRSNLWFLSLKEKKNISLVLYWSLCHYGGNGTYETYRGRDFSYTLASNLMDQLQTFVGMAIFLKPHSKWSWRHIPQPPCSDITTDSCLRKKWFTIYIFTESRNTFLLCYNILWSPSSIYCTWGQNHL